MPLHPVRTVRLLLHRREDEFTCTADSNRVLSKGHLKILLHQISHRATDNHDW